MNALKPDLTERFPELSQENISILEKKATALHFLNGPDIDYITIHYCPKKK